MASTQFEGSTTRPRSFSIFCSNISTNAVHRPARAKAAPFDPYSSEDVDRLDDAADLLFGQVSIDDTADTPSPPPGAHRIWTVDHMLAQFGRTPDARPLLDHALRDFERTGDLAKASASAYRLGELDGREGGWERARRFFERGLAHAKRAQQPALVAEGHRLLADAALHGSDYENAELYYEVATREWDALSRAREAADTRLLLVPLLIQLGRSRKGAAHVAWLRENGDHMDLSPETRRELEDVLRLADKASAAAPETSK